MAVKQKPTENPAGHDHTRRDHPAFGSVVVTRPQSNKRDTQLFGTRVPVSSYISIRIHEASEVRGLQGSRHQTGKYITQIDMSEAQFASLFGAVGQGNGVPCTIRYRQTGEFVKVPEIDDFSLAEDRSRHIREMTERKMAKLKEAVAKLDAILATSGSVKRSDLKDIRSDLLHGVDYAGGDFQFAARALDEHLADTMAEIQQELHAYSTSMRLQGPSKTPDEIDEGPTSNA